MPPPEWLSTSLATPRSARAWAPWPAWPAGSGVTYSTCCCRVRNRGLWGGKRVEEGAHRSAPAPHPPPISRPSRLPGRIENSRRWRNPLRQYMLFLSVRAYVGEERAAGRGIGVGMAAVGGHTASPVAHHSTAETAPHFLPSRCGRPTGALWRTEPACQPCSRTPRPGSVPAAVTRQSSATCWPRPTPTPAAPCPPTAWRPRWGCCSLGGSRRRATPSPGPCGQCGLEGLVAGGGVGRGCRRAGPALPPPPTQLIPFPQAVHRYPPRHPGIRPGRVGRRRHAGVPGPPVPARARV